MTEAATLALLDGLDLGAVDVDGDLGMRQARAVYALTGSRLVFANNIANYWKRGEGAAKIRWGTPGDWTRCKRHLTKHVGSERAKRMCAQWHHDVTGVWPGDKRNPG